MANINSAVILFLGIAVAVLGFLYYQETKNDVTLKVDVPAVSIQKN